MLKKIVNGVEVQCSTQEEAQILEEWDAHDPAKLPAPEEAITVEKLTAALKSKGVLTDADLEAV